MNILAIVSTDNGRGRLMPITDILAKNVLALVHPEESKKTAI